MSDNPIICPSCGEENPIGTKTCGFCTQPLNSQSGRAPDDGTRIINDPFEPKSRLLTPGSLIANRYEVLRELGRGGMGAVYLVADEKLVRKEVAFKDHLSAGHPRVLQSQQTAKDGARRLPSAKPDALRRRGNNGTI